jgi:hypothetical protein
MIVLIVKRHNIRDSIYIGLGLIKDLQYAVMPVWRIARYYHTQPVTNPNSKIYEGATRTSRATRAMGTVKVPVLNPVSTWGSIDDPR